MDACDLVWNTTPNNKKKKIKKKVITAGKTER